MLVTSFTCTPAFCASCAFARFSSRRVIANQRLEGMPVAWVMAIQQFVLQGLPTMRTLTSSAAFFSIALPWPTNILPLIPSKSERSIPFLRGTLPTSRAQFAPLKPSSKSHVVTMLLSSGNAQSSNSIFTPCNAFIPGSISMRFNSTG